MALGLLLIALGSAAGSAAGSLGPMIVTRVIEGAGFVLIAVAAPALVVAASTARDRGMAMGVWGLFIPIGVTTMLLLAPVVLALSGWRALWLVNAGLGVAAAALLLASGVGRGRTPVNSSQLWRDLAATIRSPAPWVLAAVSVMFGLKYSAFKAWLPTYLMEVQGRGAAEAGVMAAVVAVSHAPGVLLGGWLVGRGLPRWVTIGGASLVMGLAAWATFGLGLPPLAAFAAAVLFGFVSGFVPSAMLTAAPHFATSLAQIGAFNGIIIHGANVGVLGAAPAFAAVASHLGGWPAAGAYLALVGVVGLASSLAIRRLERRKAAGR
jgi:CP family cyanate transporter-like MFS transporter